jgi:hypothetical protein
MKQIVSNIIQFQHRDAGVRAHAAGGGGGGMSSGGDGSDTEKRLSRLEASFENASVMLTDIKSDIRLMLGGSISGGVLLIGAIVASHLRLQEDIGTLRAKDDAIIAMVESKHDAIIERLSRLEINVAVALARNDERETNQAGTSGAAPDSANSSAGREALH